MNEEHISYKDGSVWHHNWTEMYRDACSLLDIPTKRLSLYDQMIADIYDMEDKAFIREIGRIIDSGRDGRFEAQDVMMLFECRP